MVTATVSGNDQSVSPGGRVVAVNMMDVYRRSLSPLPDVQSGSLKVTKTIAGPAAGQQGPVAMLVACGEPLSTYAFLIPAHTRHGSASRVFPDRPAGTRCTVTETTDGSTSTVAVAVSATGPRNAIIHANRTTTIHLTDTFSLIAVAPISGLG